uniref:Uncharacterized protein n=1 Tax=Schistosoma mansoni TaxID=6183 RepID=A0A5K4F985_SCHMA
MPHTHSHISYHSFSTGVHYDSTSIPPTTDIITQPTQYQQTTSTSQPIDSTPTIPTTEFQSSESTTLQTPLTTPVQTPPTTPMQTVLSKPPLFN